MRLDWLADTLRNAGLDVVEYVDWKNRTARSFDQYTPVGVINHHTAGYYYLQDYPKGHWPDSSLAYKCNITIRPDGEVHALNAGWAYDSGNGSGHVLHAVRNDQPLPDLDNLTSDTGGNRWFIDIEVQHLGDGGPIETVQRDALIRTNAAICERMGWDPRFRVIGHREWAPDRKIDPRWDGVSNPMPGIREDTLKEADMPFTDDQQDTLIQLHQALVDKGVPTPNKPDVFKGLIDLYRKRSQIAYKPWVQNAIKVGGGASAGAVITEIIHRLGG